MAQFDLKNALVYFKDGYNEVGAVNHGGGYTAGATTMVVDLFTVALVNGDLFTIASTGNTQYKITAHTEGGGVTTSITFTPGLSGNVADDDAITVGPHQLLLKIGDGSVSWTEKRPIIYVRDRGLLDTVRKGDQDPVDVKLDLLWEFITAVSGSGTPTPEDVLKQIGEASNWVTSAADTCEPYAIDIEIDNAPVCPGINHEKILIPDFRYEEISHDAKAGTLSCTGKCNVQQIIVSRVPTFPASVPY